MTYQGQFWGSGSCPRALWYGDWSIELPVRQVCTHPNIAMVPSVRTSQSSVTHFIYDEAPVICWLRASICGHLNFSPAASGMSVTRHLSSACSSAEVCGSSVIPSSLLLSNIIINLFFASFYIHSAYFCLVYSNSPLLPSSSFSSSTFLLSSFSMLKYITSNLPISPPMTHMHAHADAQAHTDTCRVIQTARASVVYNDR